MEFYKLSTTRMNVLFSKMKAKIKSLPCLKICKKKNSGTIQLKKFSVLNELIVYGIGHFIRKLEIFSLWSV